MVVLQVDCVLVVCFTGWTVVVYYINLRLLVSRHPWLMFTE